MREEGKEGSRKEGRKEGKGGERKEGKKESRMKEGVKEKQDLFFTEEFQLIHVEEISKIENDHYNTIVILQQLSFTNEY